MCDRKVDETREKQTQNDGQLAESDETSANIIGRNLGDVAGGDRRCRPKTDAANDTTEDEEYEMTDRGGRFAVTPIG